MPMLVMFVLLALAVIVNVVYPGVGIAKAVGLGREWTWAFTLGLLAAILVTAGLAVKRRWDGIFIDRDNRVSLARLQLILWTVLILGSLLTAGITNAALGMSSDALTINIPSQIWALLGLGTFTAVAAPAIKDTKRAAGNPAQPAIPAQTLAASAIQTVQKLASTPKFDGLVLVKETEKDARWLDIIQGDYEGSAFVDASKFQQLLTTVLLVTVYAAALWGIMSGETPIRAFPEVKEGFLALLGISSAAYLADKQLART